MQRKDGLETRILVRLAVALAVLACGTLTAGCSVETEWREEVKLSDERVIVLDRRILSVRSGFPHSRRGPVLEEELEYKPLGAKWQLERGLTHVVQLASFAIIDGVPYLAAITGVDRSCARHGEGGHKALFFRWDTKTGWTEVSQREVPLDRLRQNLLLNTRGAAPEYDPKGLVTLKKKSTRDGAYHTEPLKVFFDARPWLRCGNGQRRPA